MLNFEKYKDEILEISKKPDTFAIDKNTNKICCCDDISCYDCKFYNCMYCILKRFEWLYQEYKEPIKLTLHEKCILESLDKEYEWIVRGKNDMLYLFENKPSKGNVGFWYCSEESSGKDLYFFDHLFKFIKWEDEDPYNIQELLENCEAIEDD